MSAFDLENIHYWIYSPGNNAVNGLFFFFAILLFSIFPGLELPIWPAMG